MRHAGRHGAPAPWPQGRQGPVASEVSALLARLGKSRSAALLPRAPTSVATAAVRRWPPELVPARPPPPPGTPRAAAGPHGPQDRGRSSGGGRGLGKELPRPMGRATPGSCSPPRQRPRPAPPWASGATPPPRFPPPRPGLVAASSPWPSTGRRRGCRVTGLAGRGRVCRQAGRRWLRGGGRAGPGRGECGPPRGPAWPGPARLGGCGASSGQPRLEPGAWRAAYRLGREGGSGARQGRAAAVFSPRGGRLGRGAAASPQGWACGARPGPARGRSRWCCGRGRGPRPVGRGRGREGSAAASVQRSLGGGGRGAAGGTGSFSAGTGRPSVPSFSFGFLCVLGFFFPYNNVTVTWYPGAEGGARCRGAEAGERSAMAGVGSPSCAASL